MWLWFKRAIYAEKLLLTWEINIKITFISNAFFSRCKHKMFTLYFNHWVKFNVEEIKSRGENVCSFYSFFFLLKLIKMFKIEIKK